MTDKAVYVFPNPTLSAKIQPLYVSSLLIIANEASFWKSNRLFHISLSLNPVASLGKLSSEISSKNSLKILYKVIKYINSPEFSLYTFEI